MQISIDNPPLQTLLFGIIFLVTLTFSIKAAQKGELFSFSKTEELKGFAILAIVFSHIGYFLVTDNSFLYPFSVLAGVGVNLFLFLSGFGLTISALKTPLSILNFYKKRLSRLFFPMWLVVVLLLASDLIFLGRSYPALDIVQTLLGIFPYADVFKSLDSPLWYFSLIFFYYLTFPLFFWKKYHYFSPFLLWFFTLFIFQLKLPVNSSVLNLYKLHFFAFPLGVLFALFYKEDKLAAARQAIKKICFSGYFKKFFVVFALIVFGYTAIHSYVGKGIIIEQAISTVTMLAIVFIFLAKNFEFKLFYIFGRYSYAVYLMHSPILSRYGWLYQFLPGFLATLFYLMVFLALGWVLEKVMEVLEKRLLL